MNPLIDIQKIVVIIVFDNLFLQLLTLPSYPIVDGDHLSSLYLIFLRIEAVEIGKHESRGVSDSTIGISNSFKYLIRYSHLPAIVRRGNP